MSTRRGKRAGGGSSGGAGTGDIEGVTAGAGLAGGGTSGTVSLTLDLASANVFTVAQVKSLEDAGTNTTLRPLIVRRTTSGTAAASLGAGIGFELEDGAGNTDSAGSIDLLWQDATSTSEDAVFNFRAMIGGTVTDLMRVSGTAGVVTAPDTDAVFSVGRMQMDSRTTDVAHWSHRDMTTTTQYAIKQSAAGTTDVNCASGQSLIFRHANTNRVQINTTGMGFFGATPVAQQALSGSRGGNAAVASIATALANLGLATDGTSA